MGKVCPNANELSNPQSKRIKECYECYERYLQKLQNVMRDIWQRLYLTEKGIN